jgi:hypothetical protein
MGAPTEYQVALAESVKASARSAAKYAADGDMGRAAEAIGRARRGAATLAAELPAHARVRRVAAEAIELAERCIVAPVEEESDETGELVKTRARLSTRTVRASQRA